MYDLFNCFEIVHSSIYYLFILYNEREELKSREIILHNLVIFILFFINLLNFYLLNFHLWFRFGGVFHFVLKKIVSVYSDKYFCVSRMRSIHSMVALCLLLRTAFGYCIPSSISHPLQRENNAIEQSHWNCCEI